MKRTIFILSFVILSLCFNSHSADLNGSQTLNIHKVVYAGTTTIKSPILVSIDGIGYINSDNNFDIQNPKSILERCGTYALICNFTDNNTIIPFYDDLIMGLDTNIVSQLVKEGRYNTFNPEFRYISKKKGCHLYRCESKKIDLHVFLVRIDYFQMLLNPQYDMVKNVKIKKRYFKAAYPKIEYIRVGVPANLSESIKM